MTMFFDPMHTMRQLLRAIPQTGRRPGRPVPTSPGAADPAFGCCPECHDFIRVGPLGPSGHAVCPSCGGQVRSLEALGSPESLGATEEL